MKVTIVCASRVFPVCSGWASKQAHPKAGKAEKREKAEGKIKETGTMSAGFRSKPLSAHCLSEARAAPCFLGHGATMSRNALARLDFDRHHRPKYPVSLPCVTGARP
jgi:hypothetical protein